MAPFKYAIAALVMFSVSGCSELIPDFSLRDNYTGKSILQPGKVPKPIKRDAEGNPIIK
jgi:hypothetical protein